MSRNVNASNPPESSNQIVGDLVSALVQQYIKNEGQKVRLEKYIQRLISSRAISSNDFGDDHSIIELSKQSCM